MSHTPRSRTTQSPAPDGGRDHQARIARSLEQARDDYRRVEQAIRHLESRVHDQPSLADLARAAGLSESHFHRLFSRWAGTTPKRFLQFLTAAEARRALDRSASVMEAAWETGLSGPGRLHDLLITLEGVSPGELKQQGSGVELRWGVHPSPFGDCFLARTDRGIAALQFLAGRRPAAAADELAERWPRAELIEDTAGTAAWAARAFAGAGNGDRRPLHLQVPGTNFQLQVWQALLQVPAGALTTYGDLARRIGRPGAVRAVGSAVARNPVAYLIPCHRVIRSTAAFGQYRWGTARKKALLAWEAGRAAANSLAAAPA